MRTGGENQPEALGRLLAKVFEHEARQIRGQVDRDPREDEVVHGAP
jgi:hypothetical protein